MTIQERILELLQEHGMWPDQAAEVVEMVKADKANEAMAGRWDDSAEGYSISLIAALWFSIKDTALQYIDANCPKAWFRPMFTGELDNKA